MIGIGWVTALGSWLTTAGPGGAIVAFVCGGVVMVLIGLCYAELTSAMPVAGGEVAFAYAAHGTGRAFLVGWFLAFGYLSVSSFEAISVADVRVSIDLRQCWVDTHAVELQLKRVDVLQSSEASDRQRASRDGFQGQCG